MELFQMVFNGCSSFKKCETFEYQLSIVFVIQLSKIRVMFEFEFRGSNAAETARNINVAFGERSANERSVRFWLKRFRDHRMSPCVHRCGI
jgi:hypothetical protein